MLRATCLGPAVFGLLFVGVSAAHAKAPERSSKPATEATLNVRSTVGNDAETDRGKRPAALSDNELAALRGEGETITIANQKLTSIVSNPSIGGDLTSGNVSLSDNALSSFNGLGNIVINTGSQVSVQSGMNVTINVNQ